MPRRLHRGFTLIELMVAMAVAALLFGALILGLGAVTGARARKAMGGTLALRHRGAHRKHLPAGAAAPAG